MTLKINDKVDFEVIEDTKIWDIVVLSQGGAAIATVTEAKGEKCFGRSGKLNVNIDYVRLANGQKVPLRAVKVRSGVSRSYTSDAQSSGCDRDSLFHRHPLFFFTKGQNVFIPKGTEIHSLRSS